MTSEISNISLKIGCISDYYSKRNKTNVKKYSVHIEFKQPDNLRQSILSVEAILQTITDFLKEGIHPDDYLGVSLSNSTSEHDAYVVPTLAKTFNASLLTHQLEKISQSNASFISNDSSIMLKVTHIVRRGSPDEENEDCEGAARLKLSNNFKEWFSRKHCFCHVNGTKCLPRALLIARYIKDNHVATEAFKKRVQRFSNDSECFIVEASKLCHQSGVDFSLASMGMNELQKMMNVLTDYRVHVYSADHFGRLVKSLGTGNKHLYLFHSRHHFDVITKIKAFLSTDYFCEECQTRYKNHGEHTCAGGCKDCGSFVRCQKEGSLINCKECNLNFVSETCFAKHKQLRCKVRQGCPECGHVIYKSTAESKHICGTHICPFCNERVNDQEVIDTKNIHRCYLQPSKSSSFNEKQIFIFYDFECMLDTSSNEHIPNLCVAQVCCSFCYNRIDIPCTVCGTNQHEFVFSGKTQSKNSANGCWHSRKPKL